MRSLKTTLTALGIAALLASPAWAQGRGGMFGGPAGLLSNKSVQQELKLDEKQVDKAKELAESSGAKMREAFESASGLEGQERAVEDHERDESERREDRRLYVERGPEDVEVAEGAVPKGVDVVRQRSRAAHQDDGDDGEEEEATPPPRRSPRPIDGLGQAPILVRIRRRARGPRYFGTP